jgi:hypothetical protein
MKESIKIKLREALSREDKSEIKDIVNKEIEKSLSSRDLEDVVEKIVKATLKNNRELEDKMVDITKNVLTQLYKTLWVKRSFWKSSLKNQKS